MAKRAKSPLYRVDAGGRLRDKRGRFAHPTPKRIQRIDWGASKAPARSSPLRDSYERSSTFKRRRADARAAAYSRLERKAIQEAVPTPPTGFVAADIFANPPTEKVSKRKARAALGRYWRDGDHANYDVFRDYKRGLYQGAAQKAAKAGLTGDEAKEMIAREVVPTLLAMAREAGWDDARAARFSRTS